MKSILISIKPKWVAKILNGEKTIEIRKTMPKCELPIQVYIYCTKQNSKYFIKNKIYNSMINGKVVAKFILDEVEELKVIHDSIYNDMVIPEYRITHKELEDYLKNKIGYAWHISNLEIFDRPRELSEFRKINATGNCWKCKLFGNGCSTCQLTKAPQSMCYIESEK